MTWRLWDREERLAVAADRWLARLHKDSSPETVRKFQAWRDRDPAHAAALTEAERNWRQTGQASPIAAARARVADTQPRESHRREIAWAAVTAAILLGIGGGIALDHETHQTAVASPEFAADAAPRLVHLRDGSTVILDRGSAIAVHYTDAMRAILLTRGRARFSVAHDAAHPFVVTAGDRTVTARGTIFDVAKQPNRVTVTMLDGVVEVKRIASHAPGSTLRLTKGHVAVATGEIVDVQPAPAAPVDWARGLETLDRLSLGEILARANRQGAKPIILSDPGMSPLHLQGQLSTTDTHALAIQLASALDLDMREEPNGYVLTPKP